MFIIVLQNEWVICRVFQKSSGVKRTHISGMMMLDSYGNEMVYSSSALPPLTDSSPSIGNNTKALSVTDSAYVPCFSNPIDVPRGIFDSLNNINWIGEAGHVSRISHTQCFGVVANGR